MIISQYYVLVSLTSYFFQCSDSLLPTDCPDVTDILLKRTKNCKLSIYPSILWWNISFTGLLHSRTMVLRQLLQLSRARKVWSDPPSRHMTSYWRQIKSMRWVTSHWCQYDVNSAPCACWAFIRPDSVRSGKYTSYPNGDQWKTGNST